MTAVVATGSQTRDELMRARAHHEAGHAIAVVHGRSTIDFVSIGLDGSRPMTALCLEVPMTASLVKELYNSPNGDRWTLCRDLAGKLVVCHQPNVASGGRASEIGADLFLSCDGHGPEYQALREALADLHHGAAARERKGELSVDAADKLCRTLGQAVARCWSTLPQEIQHKLFEAAVMSQGEVIRQELAVCLHGKHDRTIVAVQSSAVPEPDSLGG